jgi:hypothetical protein
MLSADIESLRIHAGIHSKHLGQYRLLSRRFPFAVYYQLFNDVAYHYSETLFFLPKMSRIGPRNTRKNTEFLG